MEQKNWAIVRTVVGYHRYDTAAELLLLNKIWVLQSQLTNYFYPQQKLVSKVRTGAKVSKKYDTATTPQRRAERHEKLTEQDKVFYNPGAYLQTTWAAIEKIPSWVPSSAVRWFWIGLALAVPLGVGAVMAARQPPDRPRRASPRRARARERGRRRRPA